MRDHKLLITKTLVLQILGVIISLMQFGLVINKFSTDSRIFWLSAQNILGALALSDLGVTQVIQRFAGFGKSENQRGGNNINRLLIASRRIFIIQFIFAAFIVLVFYKIVKISLPVNYYIILLFIALITLQKNKLGSILNIYKSPLFFQFTEIVVLFLRVAFIFFYHKNVVLILWFWLFTIIIQYIFLYFKLRVFRIFNNSLETSSVVNYYQNIRETFVLNLGGFFVSNLSGILILKLDNDKMKDAFLVTHRLILILSGIAQSLIFTSIPTFLKLYKLMDFDSLKTLIKDVFYYSQIILLLGLAAVFTIPIINIRTLNILPFNYYAIFSIGVILETINVVNVTVVLLKPFQPFLNITIVMVAFQVIAYIIAVYLNSIFLFISLPILVQILTTWRFGVKEITKDVNISYFRYLLKFR